MKRVVDQQEGGAIHRMVPGCGEDRVLKGDRITPEYVTGMAADWKQITDPAAKDLMRKVMEVLLGREAVAEVCDA